ncbi:MAG TPA: tRNA lysidine(34) synthetase TilS [Deltaproteobacteria bacterium]|nr:tRNA lysidine(34) synthetase TilS [Deltaproteobacteria bacterium]
MSTASLHEKVLKTIIKYRMIEPGDRILIALSGGPDSVALTCLLKDLQPRLEISLFAAHLNHGLRGTESDLDAEYAVQFARSMDIPITVEKADVLAYKKQHRLSLEMAAREVRYHFLTKTARTLELNKIATGHTANDQAEEILLNLIRGTGLTGLAGIPPVRENLFIRPLIRCFKSELIEYLREKNITFRTDSTNVDSTYLRNKIRHNIMPLLMEINPEVIKTISKTAEIIRDEEQFWVEYTGEILRNISDYNEKPRSLVIKIPDLLGLPVAVQRRIVRAAVIKLESKIWGIGFDRIEDILKMCKSDTSRAAIHLHGDIMAEKITDHLMFRPKKDIEKPWPDIAIDAPGTYEIENLFHAVIHVEFLPPKAVDHRKLGKYEAAIDADKVKLPLTVRSFRPGDRFKPLGLGGTKKLQDFFVDEKIPRYQRPYIPIICDREKIIWIVGYRLDERVKITPETKRILYIRIEER